MDARMGFAMAQISANTTDPTPLERMGRALGVFVVMCLDEEWANDNEDHECGNHLPGIFYGIHSVLTSLLDSHTDAELGITGASRDSITCTLAAKKASWTELLETDVDGRTWGPTTAPPKKTKKAAREVEGTVSVKKKAKK